MACSEKYARPDWLSLPDDTQAHILHLLRPEDLRRARLACKAWAHLLPGPALAAKQHVSLAGPLADSTEEVVAILQRCTGLTSLTLRQAASSAALASLAVQQSRLIELACCLRDQSASRPQLAALAALTGLRSLHVNFMGFDWQGWQLELSALTGLVSLRVTGYPAAFLPASLAVPRGLTELQLDCGNFESRREAALAAALSALTGLHSLRLQWHSLGDAGGLAVISTLTALTRLHLPDSLDAGEWLPQALAHLPLLRDLRAGSWQRAVARPLAAAVARLAAVTRLDLHIFCVGLPLEQLLAALPSLTELHLRCSLKCPVSYAGLSCLTGLTALTAFLAGQLSQDVRRAALGHIAAATQLSHVSLQGPGLIVAPPALPRAASLDVSGALLVSWSPAVGAQLAHLRSLSLTVCGIGGTIPQLSACAALTALCAVCYCRERFPVGQRCLDVAGLASLEALPQLAQLALVEQKSLSGVAHPRRCIQQAARCCSLRQLTLDGVCADDDDCTALARTGRLECVTLRFADAWPPEQVPALPLHDGPGVTALLRSGCRVVYEDTVRDSGWALM